MMTATYSPEDNKLRLYSDYRLGTETYNQVKAAGFDPDAVYADLVAELKKHDALAE